MLYFNVDKREQFNAFRMPVPHMHNFFELYFLVKGSRTIRVENEDYSLTETSCLLIPPHFYHVTSGASNKDTHIRYVLSFSLDFLDDTQKEIVKTCQLQKIPLSPREASFLENVLENLLRFKNDNSNKQDAIKHTFQICLNYFIFNLSLSKEFPKKEYIVSNYNYRVKKLLAFIHENYSKTITLDLLATHFFVSKKTLSNEFKKNTGLSIADYVLHTRLEHAKEMLIYASNLTLDLIAEQCGFSSSKYFRLIFTKKFNLTPTQYRKRYKNFTDKKKNDYV